MGRRKVLWRSDFSQKASSFQKNEPSLIPQKQVEPLSVEKNKIDPSQQDKQSQSRSDEGRPTNSVLKTGLRKFLNSAKTKRAIFLVFIISGFSVISFAGIQIRKISSLIDELKRKNQELKQEIEITSRTNEKLAQDNLGLAEKIDSIRTILSYSRNLSDSLRESLQQEFKLDTRIEDIEIKDLSKDNSAEIWRNTEIPLTAGGRTINLRDTESVRRVILRHRAVIRDFYEREYKKNSVLAGSLTIRFGINAKGHLINPESINSSLPPELTQKILETMSGWKDFGEKSGAQIETFKITFSFGF